MKLKPFGKIAVLILAIGAAIGLWQIAANMGVLPGKIGSNSVVPGKANLPGFDPTGNVSVSNISMPAPDRVTSGKEVRWLVWAWNAQMGIMFANGGPQTTKGSLMADRGINLTLTRQDDSSKMQEALTAFATELKNGNPNPTGGAHFVSIMGDGGASFLSGLNEILGKLGPEYKAKIVATAGFSHGEDKFMGPAEWKKNPRSAMGGVVTAYLRDGDWNIVQKWLGDNGLKTNPDEKTYDPDALNWVAANDYVDAAEKYISGYSEDRPVVKNGKLTGERKHITVQGVSTWTPADVSVAERKGGVVSIVSTKEYASQMPCVIIGIDKWMKDNRETVQNLVEAVCLGSASVKGSPDALHKAAEISAAVYKEKDAPYWEKYYKGVNEPDKTGVNVDLGGSAVNNLADNLLAFGLAPGSQNVVQATYQVFGDIVHNQYPDLMPSYPPAKDIIDISYLEAVAKKVNTDTGAIVKGNTGGSTTKPGQQDTPGQIVGRRNWKIEFDSGRATFGSSAEGELEQLLKDLLVASNTFVEIHGHTDSAGNPDANLKLSEDRAFAVKKWLEDKASMQMEGRIKIYSHGQTEPLQSNSTEAGRAANRRVEIKILSTAN